MKKIIILVLMCFFASFSAAENLNKNSVSKFVIEENLQSDIGWVEDKEKIYYTAGEKHDVYSVYADGSGRVKVIEGILGRMFGWSPSGDRMFFVAEGGLFIAKTNGTSQEKIADAIQSQDTEDVLRGFVAPVSAPGHVEWSPDGKFLLFSIVDKDTNKDGKVKFFYDSDGENYYLFNLDTKEKRIVFSEQKNTNYPKDYAKAVLWSKDAKKIYIFNTYFSSGNDYVDQVFAYDVDNHRLQKIQEGNERQSRSAMYSMGYIENLKDSLFFTRKNFPSDLFLNHDDFKEHGGIDFECVQGKLVLMKTLSSSKSIYDKFELGNCGDFPAFLWLPNKKHLIFRYKANIYILDPYAMKVGILAKGSDFGFFKEKSEYETWNTWWRR